MQSKVHCCSDVLLACEVFSCFPACGAPCLILGLLSCSRHSAVCTILGVNYMAVEQYVFDLCVAPFQ